MIVPGLVSVTFRALDPSSILDLCNQAHLRAVEWGGDVHVPTGDLKRAREVGAETRSKGLDTISYGSYYRLGTNPDSFGAVLETAEALQAPSIRVWAGVVSSRDAVAQEREDVRRDLVRISELAKSRGLRIALEHHRGTLADDADAALQVSDVPDVSLYWQPNIHVPSERREQELAKLLPKLSHVHVFHWTMDGDGRETRHRLIEGESEWRRYLRLLANSSQVHGALLEFVDNDSPNQLLDDASVLHRWLGELSPDPS